MCAPFEEKHGDWRRFGRFWTAAFFIRHPVPEPRQFVREKSSVLQNLGLTCAFVSGRAVHGREHMLACAFHALRSHNRERMRTRSLGMEVLLHASGSHHVDKALGASGIVEGEEEFWLLLFKECAPGLCSKPSVEELTQHLGFHLLPGLERDHGTAAGVERAALLGL